MSVLGYIIIFSLIGSVASLAGGIILLWKEEATKKISKFLISFAAGALLGAAFLDLIPEAIEGGGGVIVVMSLVLVAMIAFFLLEKLLVWYHCHDEHCDVHTSKYLIIIGDTIHNFIDGIIIATTFLISIPLGIVTSIAVALHEIPQEIGDFSILLHQGVSKKNNILLNLLTALATLVGATFTYFFLRERADALVIPMISLAAGAFIYIATADLIPELHGERKIKSSILQTVLIILGILAIWYTSDICNLIFCA